ncbi:MAG: HlyC/CorC family transporter [Anaerolineales bacterium]|nr:HlyC/CorC family transporter [Anaerolineales bacterium]
MEDITLEIIILLLLILLNGLFSMSEFAVVSARKSRLQPLAENGNENARTALELAKHPDRFLATIQIGITLVGTLAGAIGGATIARQVAAWMAGLPLLSPYAEAISVTLVVLAITFLTLVLGELVPKQLALHSSERLAMAVAEPMRKISRVASPLVRVLAGSSNFIVRMLGIRPSKEPPVTEDEIRVLIEQGTQAGVFEEAEQEMVEGVFRLGGQRVGSLMTPRPDVDWIDLDESPGVIHDQILNSHRSRFPVAQGDLDGVLGILRVKDLLVRNFSCDPQDIRKLLRPPLFIPENAEALQALEEFKENRERFAVVTDEFGGVAGVISSTDILEAIVGDLPLKGEAVEPEVLHREDGSWLLGGALSIGEMEDHLELERLLDEEEVTFQTLGGFMMARLGEVPRAGDRFDWGGYRFEVLDMDGRRVDKVLVTPLPPDSKEPRVA